MMVRVMLMESGQLGSVLTDVEGEVRRGDYVVLDARGRARKAKGGETGVGVVMREWCPEGCLLVEEVG